ncbi:MAG: tetratricopeptide repeat protein [Marinilabiliaceae bacterium]|jgi:tetratricopeptide (TPR) repeat protein|nr:tetratricopeptide repeat protein [Marinilabiliaceae bacterium]
MPDKKKIILNFWKESKRRKVWRVLTIYAGTSFIILEAVDIIFPRIGFPDWSINLILYIMLFGALVTFVLAWIYDLTPEGIEKTRPVSDLQEESGTHPDGRKFRFSDGFSIVLLIIVLILLYPKIFKRNLVNTSDIPSIAVLYLENLGDEDDEYYSYGITEDIIIDLSKAGLIKVPTIKDVMSFKDSNSSLVEIAQALNVKYILTGSLRNESRFMRLALQLVDPQKGINLWSDRWEEPVENVPGIKGKVIDAVIESLGIRLNDNAKHQINKESTTDPDAYEFYLKARYRLPIVETKEDLEVVRGFFSHALELDSLFVLARIGLGDTYKYEGNTDLAMGHYKKALLHANSLDLPIEKSLALINSGSVYRTYADYPEAINNYEEALRISRQIDDHLNEAAVLQQLGIIYDDQNQFDKALEYFQESLSIAREIKNEDQEYRCLNSIGIIYHKKANYDRALENFEKSMAIRLKLGHHRSAAIVLYNMSVIEFERGRFQEAIDKSKQALEIFEEIGDKDGISFVVGGLGNIYFALGFNTYATKYLERSLELTKEVGDLSTEGYTLFNLANICKSEGNYPKAINLFRESLEIFNNIGDVRMSANAQSYLGSIYYMQDQLEKAEECYKNAVPALDSLSMLSEYLDAQLGLMLTRFDLGKESDCLEDLKSLELMIDTINIKDISSGIFWYLYLINNKTGNKDNGIKYLELAYGKVMEIKNNLQADTLIQTYLKSNEEIISKWKEVNTR